MKPKIRDTDIVYSAAFGRKGKGVRMALHPVLDSQPSPGKSRKRQLLGMFPCRVLFDITTVYSEILTSCRSAGATVDELEFAKEVFGDEGAALEWLAEGEGR